MNGQRSYRATRAEPRAIDEGLREKQAPASLLRTVPARFAKEPYPRSATKPQQ